MRASPPAFAAESRKSIDAPRARDERPLTRTQLFAIDVSGQTPQKNPNQINGPAEAGPLNQSELQGESAKIG